MYEFLRLILKGIRLVKQNNKKKLQWQYRFLYHIFTLAVRLNDTSKNIKDF